ncbi:MAG: hypothetical protein HY270_01510 [Deltaproteobacteria bacterium]|nr:hypothetical protein [Deltaproteobacteria bacterium]
MEKADVVLTLRKRLGSLTKGVKTRPFEDALEDLQRKYGVPVFSPTILAEADPLWSPQVFNSSGIANPS